MPKKYSKEENAVWATLINEHPSVIDQSSCREFGAEKKEDREQIRIKLNRELGTKKTIAQVENRLNNLMAKAREVKSQSETLRDAVIGE